MGWAKRGALCAVVALFFCGASSAAERTPDLTKRTDGYTIYNRPGATIADHRDAVRACVGNAVKIGMKYPYVRSSEDFLKHARAHLADRVVAANVEHCMVAKGWRVVRLGVEAMKVVHPGLG